MDMQRIVGHNVRFLRETKGFSQESFASKSGFKRTYIGAVERGEMNLTLSSLCQLANALGVQPSILLIDNAFKKV
jgi:transcriptional regulator with XRE-family HTH domain